MQSAKRQSGEIAAIRSEIKSDRRWVTKMTACVLGWLLTACCLAYQTFAKQPSGKLCGCAKPRRVFDIVEL